MFKILKETTDTYSMTCYNYNTDDNLYNFVYSARGITLDDVVFLLQGRLKHEDDIEWIESIVTLTNQQAIIGDDGILRAVPMADGRKHGTERKRNQVG